MPPAPGQRDAILVDQIRLAITAIDNDPVTVLADYSQVQVRIDHTVSLERR